MTRPPHAVDVLVRRLDPDVPLPTYAHPGDAGLDLVTTVDCELAPVRGVDRARRVDDREAVLQRQTGPRVDEAGVPLGQRDRDAGR